MPLPPEMRPPEPDGTYLSPRELRRRTFGARPARAIAAMWLALFFQGVALISVLVHGNSGGINFVALTAMTGGFIFWLVWGSLLYNKRWAHPTWDEWRIRRKTNPGRRRNTRGL